MLTIILWVIFGIIVGAIAKMIMPGNQNMGWLMTSALGIVGSFVGGFLAISFFGHWCCNRFMDLWKSSEKIKIGSQFWEPILFIWVGVILEKCCKVIPSRFDFDLY